ncbi:MAG: hypothetical protein ACXVIP_05365, partial [Halobacteriota archaeon]
ILTERRKIHQSVSKGLSGANMPTIALIFSNCCILLLERDVIMALIKEAFTYHNKKSKNQKYFAAQ